MSKPLTKEIMKELAETATRLNDIYNNYGFVSCDGYDETVHLAYEDFCDYCTRYGIEYETEAEYSAYGGRAYFSQDGVEFFALRRRTTDYRDDGLE